MLKSGPPPGSRRILYLYGKATLQVTPVFPFQEYKSKAPKQTSAASLLLENRPSLVLFFNLAMQHVRSWLPAQGWKSQPLLPGIGSEEQSSPLDPQGRPRFKAQV